MKLTTNYNSRTPFTVELVSDILFIISQAAVGYSVFEGNVTLAWISIVTGTLAKILARFTEESHAKEGLSDSPTATDCGCNGTCACSKEA
jgi:hypothetical protein